LSKLTSPQKKGVVRSGVSVPKLESGEILVKVSHVALNPTDWKHLDMIANKNSILGCDYSGTVQSTGEGSKKFNVGDRVCGVVHGGKFPNRGSFAEYLIVKEEFSMAVPKELEDAEAATYGVGFCTAAMVRLSAD
jgi:NADPH:quinone reductase-like Zn-dependent oxidoreductase